MKRMKTTTQDISWKNWNVTTALLMLGLALSTLTIEVARAAKPPNGPVYSDAASVYPTDLVFSASKLTHNVPGIAGPDVITWNSQEAQIRLDSYNFGEPGASPSKCSRTALGRSSASRCKYSQESLTLEIGGGTTPPSFRS